MLFIRAITYSLFGYNKEENNDSSVTVFSLHFIIKCLKNFK